MSPVPAATLWQRTVAHGALGQRFLSDERSRLCLQALDGGTTLAAPADVFAGRNVMLRTGTQLATACALLELDGLARRVVLCPPGLSLGQAAQAAREAEATLVVSDDAAEAGELPLQVQSLAPGVREQAGGGVRHAGCETEWVLFTSGSTGAPKLVLHRLASLLAAIPPVTADIASRRKDSAPANQHGATGTPESAAGPAAHAPAAPDSGNVFATFYDVRRYGGLQILLRALVGGGSMLLSSQAETPGAFLARAGQAGIAFLSGTPTHWRRALLSPQAAMIAPRDVRLSGEVADQAILDALRAAYPEARICHAFASTEAGVGFAVDDGLAGFPAGWLGQARGDVELCAAGGTLRLRSPGNATRYLGEAAPALRAPDGFVNTHDAVETTGDRARFAGRRDGVINVGGQKVHPEEVEAAVNGHPGVAMSQARAKASRITGAIVVVDVVLRDAAVGQTGAAPREVESDILRTCRAILAAHKVPAAVRFVPELGVSTSGKLIRSHA